MIALIESNLKVSMGLKIYQFGGLEYLSTPANIANFCPAVFVKPITIDNTFKELAQSYRMIYTFRIVYVRKYNTTEAVVKLKVQDMTKFAELFLEKMDLDSLSLTNGAIEYSLVEKIEYEPPEDDFIYAVNAQLSAGALVYTISVLTEHNA